MFDKRRLNVHLYVTPICNLNCKHCYYNSKSQDFFLVNFLQIDELSFIIRKLYDNFDIAIDAEGGEFFLREDVSRLFEIVPSNCWNKITITTNGVKRMKIDLNHLHNLDEFRVSVEGHNDIMQQDIRGISLKPVLKTCEELRLNGVPITLRVTLHKKNYKYLNEMIEFFLGLNIKRFSFYEFQPVGRGKLYENEYKLDGAEMENILKLLLKINIDSRLDILKFNLGSARNQIVNAYKTELNENGYKILNLQGVPSLTINYNGELGICPWNIGQDTIGKFHKSSFISDITKYIEDCILDHECMHCSAKRILYQGERYNI